MLVPHMAVRIILAVLTVLALAAFAPAQTAPAPTADLGVLLAQLEQTAQTTNLDLAKLRIEKWKGGGDAREQFQGNADALSRNLNAALPGMVSAVRATPENFAANFKLYRNIDALYDVLSTLAEAAGAYGPRSDYQALAADVSNLEALRRSLADRLEAMATLKDAELARLRGGGSSAKSGKSRVKKIVVDDAPARTRKKKPASTPQ
jgi:hypothetical protein